MAGSKSKKSISKRLAALLMSLVLVFSVTGCGSKEEKAKNVPELKEVTEIPEDGIITKEQFATVAGKDKVVKFVGETPEGITYEWSYNAAQIMNPDHDQNLKIDFTTEGLEDVKKEAGNANDALKMTMHGEWLLGVPTLTVTLPEAWKSNAGLLLKEQSGKLARMSDVTIESQPEEKAGKKAKKADKKNDTAPAAGKTVLTMNVTSISGDSYIVGGITEVQNPGAVNANKGGTQTGQTAGGQTTTPGTTPDADVQGGGTTDNGGEDVKTENQAKTCTISINCATLLNNMDVLPKEKHEFVPGDGWILPPTIVEFEEGESVHDILKRVCRDAGIHMESTYTPMYESAYVEGINQLYEFDGGELSGWMFKVNGWFPNYGCSRYTVSDGDVIDWVYTCDLGVDVGGESAMGN